jgi:protoheme IX farnesyltransferase
MNQRTAVARSAASTAEIDGSADVALPAGREAVEAPSHLADLYELTKPRMNFLIVITTMVGCYMGSGGSRGGEIHWLTVLHACLGTAMTASSAGILNQFLERGYDALMVRTRNRPLPSGRINLLEALLFGVGIGGVGLLYLAFFVNYLTAFLGAATLLTYIFVYTPMKRTSSLNTVVGAIPGALPPVMGFAAVQGRVSPEALAVFFIMFIWQMPHFLAIAILYRDDYARGGFKMLPVIDPDLSLTRRQILVYSLTLIPVTIVPCILGMAGGIYFTAAVLLGLAFLSFAISCAATCTRSDSRKLFFASIIYLPLLFGALMIDKVG